jgi:LPXTG-motif cell wall-anchored protein
MRSRLAAALAAMAALLAAGLVGVAPAQATNHVHASATQPEPVCEATWKMRGATGAYPAVTFGGPPPGSTIGDYFAKLVKPAEGVQPGVEFAAFDLEIQAPADNELLVGVDYATDDGATTAAGAIRLFGYAAQDANTLNDAPTYGPAVAASESGHLVLTIPAGKTLGTLGMVYDASNSSSGSVTFSDLKIGTRPVRFTGCPEPEPTATPTPTTGPTGQPTEEPEPVTCASFATQAEAQAAFDADPEGLAHLDADNDGKACEWGASPEPSGTAAPVPTLPITGSSTTLWMVLAGLAALGSGVLLFVLSRRRRVQFRA